MENKNKKPKNVSNKKPQKLSVVEHLSKSLAILEKRENANVLRIEKIQAQQKKIVEKKKKLHTDIEAIIRAFVQKPETATLNPAS